MFKSSELEKVLSKRPFRHWCRRYASTNARSYGDAITKLNGLQKNRATVELIRQNPAAMHAVAIPEMHDWLRKAGYQASDFNKLNAIHIAGTKGKGSTSTFISSILAQYLPESASPSLSQIGLYTSPHLRFVRERIQLNNAFLSEHRFASAFFEVWDRLETSARDAGLDPVDPSTKPAYFRYLTIIGLHTFLKHNVDSAVIECGTGGEYDSTNILQQPTVTAITKLDIDHVEMLGGTIDKIAQHKAGIMKPGAAAYTVPQPKPATAVLEQVARERGVKLNVVEELHPSLETTKLGLQAPFQRSNANLAVAVAADHLLKLGIVSSKDVHPSKELPAQFLRGLESAYIGGRCETRKDAHSSLTWRIDGAHTMESIQAATEWFSSCTTTRDNSNGPPRILLFNQQGREERVELLRKLHDTMVRASESDLPFTHVIFCSNKTFEKEGYRPDLVSINTDAKEVEDLKAQKEMAQAWEVFARTAEAGETAVRVFRTIEEAVGQCRNVANSYVGHVGGNTEVFVTGSLHLVGGVLDVLES